MKIRKARKEDIESCVTIEYSVFKENKDIIRYDLNKQIKDNDYILLVAEEKGEVIGFLTAKTQLWNQSVYLERLFVKEEFRKQGIGSKLLDEIKQIAKKKKALGIFVDTGTFFQFQVRFYTRNGFRIIGFIKDLYLNEKNEKDRDAIMLCFKLNQ